MIGVPSSEEVSDLTDWVEASCLFSDVDSLSYAEIRSTLDSARLKDPQSIVNDIWRAVNIRCNQAAIAYPIRTELHRFVRVKDWNQAIAYSYQLLLACRIHYPELQSVSMNDLAKKFELLSEVAVRQYLNGLSLNIGHPRRPPLPRSFRQCLDQMCEQLRETRGSIEQYSTHTKDGEVDVVAWIPFEDNLPSQLALLLGCAAGRDWDERPSQVCNTEIWRDYVSWHVPPVRAFAFPFVCPDTNKWREVSRKGGILFDRLRISSLFEASSPDDKTKVTQELEKPCSRLASKLPKLDARR